MKIATCDVGSPVYVPSGEYLDGSVLEAPAWARKGRHTLSEAFARLQEQNGLLEIDLIDGRRVVWGSCCTEHG